MKRKSAISLQEKKGKYFLLYTSRDPANDIYIMYVTTNILVFILSY